MTARTERRRRVGGALERGLPAMLSVALGALVVGCTVGPDYVPPEPPVVEEWVQLPSEGLQVTSDDLVAWWSVFEDPVLEQLVALAYENNNNLEIAGLNVLAARAALGIATGTKWPQGQVAFGDVGYVSPSNRSAVTNGDFQYNLGASVSWEIDLWGRFERGIEAASAGVLAAEAGYEEALILLTGLVVDTYSIIRVTEELLRIAAQNIEIQQRSYDITRTLFEYGEDSELDMQQAQRLLLSTQATVPAREATLQTARNALNILVGQPPGVIDELLKSTESAILEVPESIAIGVPTDLLRRRPDVRKAEYQAMAQNAQVGVAVADLYPAFTLAGVLGASSGFPEGTSPGDLFSTDAIAWNAGAGVLWPFLNYGRIRNNIRVQDARLQQALIAYQESVLVALREAEDAMAAFVGAQKQRRILEETVAAASRSNELSVVRYREGFADFQRVIDSQQALFSQQERWIDAKRGAVSALVALYSALGGGWEIDPNGEWVSEESRRQMQERTDWSGYLPEEDEEETEANDGKP